MIDSRNDASLVSQLETLRGRALEQLTDGVDAPAALVAVVQRLDALALAVRAGELDDEALRRALSEATDALSSAADDQREEGLPEREAQHAALVRQTLPASAGEALLARNQARLVEHVLARQAEGAEVALETVQQALLSYAHTHGRLSPQARAAAQASSPAALQRRLSGAVDARLRAALVRPADIAARVREGALLEQGDGTPVVASTGDLRQDLMALLERADNVRETRAALDRGDLVLARVEVDSAGRTRAAQPHRVSTPQVAEAAPQQPAAAPPSPARVAEPRESTVEAIAAHAELEASRRHVAALQRELESRREATEAERAALEAASARLEAARARAAQSRAHLEALHANERHAAEIEQLVAATRGAAEGLVLRSLRGLGTLATRLADITRSQAAHAHSPEERAPHELTAQAIGTLAAQIETLSPSAASPQDVEQIAAQLRQALADSLNKARASATPEGERTAQLLEPLVGRVESVAERGIAAAYGTRFSLDVASHTQPHTDETQAATADALAAAQSTARLAEQRDRFESVAYATSDLQERVLTAEQVVAPPQRTRPRAIKPARLATPASGGTVQVKRIDHAALRQQAESRLRELQGLDRIHGERNVNLFADNAGLELSRAASEAARVQESATLAAEIVARATENMRREVTYRLAAARLARSAGSLGHSASARGELGLPGGAQFELQPGLQAPLFKRKMGLGQGEGSAILPALYAVAGFGHQVEGSKKRAPVKSGMMLRKAASDDGADLTGSNLSLIASIEHTFGNMGPRGRRLSGYGERNTQEEEHMKSVGSAIQQATASFSEWVANRHMSLSTINSAEPQDQFETGTLRPSAMIGNLTSEARQIPTSVRSKLEPMLGASISDVSIYAGPIATMAANVFNARAFTIGKHIFFDESQLNLDSAEGLALLAHELKHTTHFSEGSSVEQKEKEAEQMEARVRQAFGSVGGGELALERPGAAPGGAGGPGGDSTPTPTPQELNRYNVSDPLPPGKGGHRPAYDPDIMVRTVYDLVVGWFADTAKKERLRRNMT